MTDQAVSLQKPAKTYEYRDLSRLSTWIRYLAIALIAGAILSIVFSVLEHMLLQRIVDGNSGDEIIAEAEASDVRQMVISSISLCLLTAYGILSLIWLYRGNANLRALGRQDLRFTPGWMIGWYFIPIANLWKPYQAMCELWRASARRDWRDHEAPAFLLAWWLIGLLSQFVDRIYLKMEMRADTIVEMLRANEVSTVSDVLSIPILIMGFIITGAIRTAQAATAEEQRASPEPLQVSH